MRHKCRHRLSARVSDSVTFQGNRAQSRQYFADGSRLTNTCTLPEAVEGKTTMREFEQTAQGAKSKLHLEAFPCQRLWKVLEAFQRQHGISYSTESRPVDDNPSRQPQDRQPVIVALQGKETALINLELALDKRGLLASPVTERFMSR